MASNPPGECCLMGSLHEGEPKGEFKDIDGVDTYISYPHRGGKYTNVLFLLSDVMGNRSKNTQLIADNLAARGYLVVAPDQFNGDPVPPYEQRPPGFSLWEWLRGHTLEVTEPIVEKVYQAIKRDYAPKEVGTIGYCFGAKYAVRLLDGKADAAFINHPSFVDIEEIAAIKGPLGIAAAETDTIFTTELRRQTEDKLAEIKATYQINLYGRVEHGFAIRGDMSDPSQKYAKEDAFRQMVIWFDRFLGERVKSVL